MEPVEEVVDLVTREPATIVVLKTVAGKRDIEFVLDLFQEFFPYVDRNDYSLGPPMGPEVHRFPITSVEALGNAVEVVSGFTSCHDIGHANIVRKSVRICKQTVKQEIRWARGRR
jgi:hypothetical protein